MSFLARFGNFLTGSQDSLDSGEGRQEEAEVLDETGQAYLEQACSALQTAALIEDRRVAARSLVSFSKAHRIVSTSALRPPLTVLVG